MEAQRAAAIDKVSAKLCHSIQQRRGHATTQGGLRCAKGYTETGEAAAGNGDLIDSARPQNN